MMGVYFFFLIIYVFMGVFFVTLLERKILGILQFRLGPNKVSLKGFIQSLSDFIKLLGKGMGVFIKVDWFEYNIMPLGMLCLMLGLWSFSGSDVYSLKYSILIILCLLSLGVYPIMYGGWYSGSFYSMMGALRSIAQMISYEVSLILIIMSVFMIFSSFSIMELNNITINFSYMFFWFMLLLFSSIMVEINRTPFDLVEGESELVSGFNTEYYGFKFALIFLAEYGMILYMSGFFISMILGNLFFGFNWCIYSIVVILLIIWIRGVLPRIRYDKLMFICWVIILNMSMGILCLMLGYKLTILWM